ncbi:hypothetical protein BH23PAT1_BH23PAT1_3140 [soil metagenome]
MNVSGERQTPESDVVNDITKYIGPFTPQESLRMGDSDSAHEVLFGALDPYGMVAIKPFTKEGKARGEVSAMNRIRERGFETFDPIMVATGSLAAYLVTYHREGLRNLGQVAWDVESGSHRLGTAIIPKLRMAADVSGRLHGAGVEHGDFQAKNVAFTRSGEPVIVDLERTLIGRAKPDLIAGSEKDMNKFSLSILARGLLYDRSPHYRAHFLGEEFIAPSIERANKGSRIMDPEQTRTKLEANIQISLEEKERNRQARLSNKSSKRAA